MARGAARHAPRRSARTANHRCAARSSAIFDYSANIFRYSAKRTTRVQVLPLFHHFLQRGSAVRRPLLMRKDAPPGILRRRSAIPHYAVERHTGEEAA